MKTNFTLFLMAVCMSLLLISPDNARAQGTGMTRQISKALNPQNATNPGNLLLECPDPVLVPVSATLCGTNVVYSQPVYAGGVLTYEGTSSGSFFPVGVSTVTFKVTDANGNFITCAITVTVIDNQPPTVTTYPADFVGVTDPGVNYATQLLLTPPDFADNCGIVTNITNNAQWAFFMGNNVITWTATDAAGNIRTVNQNVIIYDGEAPVIIVPADVTVNTDPGAATASGVVLGEPVAYDNDLLVSVSNDAPLTYPVGTTAVKWTAVDASGNVTDAFQNVIVVDVEPPVVVTPPTPVTLVTVPGLPYVVNTGLTPPVFADNSGNLTITNNAPPKFYVGNTTVIWTATDQNGNQVTIEQIITVADNEAPVISSPANVTYVADAGVCYKSNAFLGTPVTSDNNVVSSVTNDAPTIFQTGTTIVTWTVTDASGNTAVSTQTVTVTDAQAPTVSVVPASVSVNADAGKTYASGVVLNPPVFADNCSQTITVTNNAPALFPIGTTLVRWTATDGSGNIKTANSVVSVIDNQAPVIACPGNITRSACNNVVTYAITATDNGSGASVVAVPPSGTAFPIGTTTVTVTATDLSGNTSVCYFDVIVTPNPVATASYNTGLCAGSTLSLFASGGVSYSWTGPGGFTSTLQNPTRSSCGGSMAGTYTVTVTDASGCTATASVNVVMSPLPSAPTAISGTASPLKGGKYTYTTTITNATSYIWTYSGTGATITSSGNTISISFSSTATSGTLSVKGVNACGNGPTANVCITVKASSCIHVFTSRHVIGSGCHPNTIKHETCPQVEPGTKCGFKVYRSHDIGYTCKREYYDKIYNKSCQGVPGNPVFNYDSDVTGDCYVEGPVLSTAGGGPANLWHVLVPEGKRYVVLGKFGGTTYNGNTQWVCAGERTYNKNGHAALCDEDNDGDDESGDDPWFTGNQPKDMWINIIQDANGKIRPCNTDAIPGSMILVTSPYTVEFTDSVELLPIVYESIDGYWEVGVTATPPQGFYSVEDTLQTALNTSFLNTLQFTLVDTGSVWTNTVVTTNLKHNGKEIKHTVAPKMIDNKSSKDYLGQNYPNPFSDVTSIPYSIPTDCKVTLKVYDLFGRELLTLVDKNQKKGSYKEDWNGSVKSTRLPTGTYLVRLQATDNDSGKVVVNSKSMIYLSR